MIDGHQVVLVTGDREWTDVALVRQVLNEFPPLTILKHGNARGLDTIADAVGTSLGFDVRRYPANWVCYGKKAGVLRNSYMVNGEPHPDVVIAFHDDLAHSKGTADCVKRAVKIGLIPRLISHS